MKKKNDKNRERYKLK